MDETKALIVLGNLISEMWPGYVEKFSKLLSSEEKAILDEAIPYYEKAGRVYDLWHIPYSSAFMIDLCNELNLKQTVYVVASILHDIGYSQIIPKSRGVAIGIIEEDDRISHMKHGVKLTQKILKEIDGSSIGEKEQELIIKIISTHDDPYIGKKLVTNEEKYHRDSDRIYVMSFTSFVKDYYKKRVRGENINPHRLLQERIVSMHRAGDLTNVDIPEKYIGLFKSRKDRYFELFFTEFAIRKNIEQIKERIRDVENGVFELGENEFKAYCMKRMQEEVFNL